VKVDINNLKADMPGEIRSMAEFLEIDIDENRWPDIIEHCTFEYMKANAHTLSSVFGDLFDGGLKNFVYKGTNGRWRDTLSSEDIQKYEKVVSEKLTPDCAHWHATGEIAS
jgi:aryl sulfotransferase